jgi:hypothetical protein
MRSFTGGNRQGRINPNAIANTLQGLIDEIRQDILYSGHSYNRADARYLYFLASVFP